VVLIDSFKDEYRWLSNFWPAQVVFDGKTYNSVESAYIAGKTKDKSEREIIRNLPTPGKAKRYGKDIALRDDWDEVKIPIMRNLLTQKFKKGSELGNKLLSTGNIELIEGNTWGDTFWGVCDGIGENHLGNLLMQIRESLK
jgi:ribA/ribD-fused uncharacterized protein